MEPSFLFITRNYPPKIGGLEAYSFNLIHEFEQKNQTYKITLTKSNRHLIWFFPYSLLKALHICWKQNLTNIHLCDALLSPIGILLKLLTQAKISVSVVGLDITFHNFFYQLLIPRCVRQLDQVICISRATRDECTSRGIPSRRCTVIPIGINPNDAYLPFSKEDVRHELEKKVDVSVQYRKVLLTVGRLVKRKGVAWFVEHVMPQLDARYLYLIVGAGPEKDRIQQLVARYQLEDCVFLMGKRSNAERNILLNASDMFIMPNITVPGDVEGFGIVAIEAGSCGLPVIASNLQGIRDAVLDGQSGILVEERNANAYMTAIQNMQLDREQIRTTVISTFNWATIYDQYYETLVPDTNG
ncbi:MAG: glycosyltransferase family 4 protein [Desulfobacterales bacterium]|jgi:phosphatidylinositol alpha-1,6-mannosyltransferase